MTSESKKPMTRAEFIAKWGCAGMDHVNQDLERDFDALLDGEREASARIVEAWPVVDGAVLSAILRVLAQAIRSGGRT